MNENLVRRVSAPSLLSQRVSPCQSLSCTEKRSYFKVPGGSSVGGKQGDGVPAAVPEAEVVCKLFQTRPQDTSGVQLLDSLLNRHRKLLFISHAIQGLATAENVDTIETLFTLAFSNLALAMAKCSSSLHKRICKNVRVLYLTFLSRLSQMQIY
ncbi:hypothetical protein GQ53DRAFT_404406 [Thozetella sp. PMI_491]|nr:hypothetical protein GQ53DRAFT_404406 [Thozetella sp. PMI_491]